MLPILGNEVIILLWQMFIDNSKCLKNLFPNYRNTCQFITYSHFVWSLSVFTFLASVLLFLGWKYPPQMER